MKIKFQKVKTEHHILPEFHKILQEIEKNPKVKRIIPWRISRQQKGSSQTNFRISYWLHSGLRAIMSKWATAQELFILCDEADKENVKSDIEKNVECFF